MKRLLQLILIFLSGTPLSYAEESDSHWDIGLGAGVSFPHVDTLSIENSDGWPDDTLTVDNVDTTGIFSAFVGYRLENDEEWLPDISLRLNYLYGLSTTVSGDVHEYSLPEFDNYDYEYRAQSQALLALLKIDWYEWEDFLPFVSFGIGAAWNRVSDYDETAEDGITPRLTPDIDNNTHSDFAFLLGAGIDYLFEEDWFLTLEYNYVDFGDVALGNNETAITSSLILLSLGYSL